MKLNNIECRWSFDTDTDLSHYGTYSDTPGEFYVKTSEERKPGRYQYFNATNVSNRQEAHENYKIMRRLDTGEWAVYSCYAQAKVIIAGTVQTIQSGGLCGIEEPDEAYRAEIEAEELRSLANILREMGFTQSTIDEAFDERIIEVPT
jgi:hypothetical protein